MRASRLRLLTLVTLVPAAAALADSVPASAGTYQSCVANLQSEHLAVCKEARQENIHAACPPLSQLEIQRVCGTAPVPVNGVLHPKFTVVSVIYSPPGSSNKGGGSSVDYGQGTTIGVTESVGSSFKQDLSTSASTTLGTPVTGTVDFTITASSSDTTGQSASLDIKKSSTSDVNVAGPATDGIDHQQDEIWMLLSPVVNVQAIGNAVTWSMGMDNNTVPQFVRVAWLNNPSSMPAAVAQTLAAHGITSADYPTILARDPFSGKVRPVDSLRPPSPPDPVRFALIDSLTYEPDSNQTTQTYALKSDTTNTTGSTASDSFSLGIQVGVSGGFADWLKVSLKDGVNWTWTNTASSSQSSDASQTATAKIVNPSLAYTGPTDVLVYWDTVYKTFLFFPPTGSPVLTGFIANINGQPAQAADVVVTVGGKKVHAFTDSKGVYRVYNLPSGAASVTANGVTQSATLGAGAKLDFQRPGIRPVPMHVLPGPVGPVRR
jgi:hypothetical protein